MIFPSRHPQTTWHVHTIYRFTGERVKYSNSYRVFEGGCIYGYDMCEVDSSGYMLLVHPTSTLRIPQIPRKPVTYDKTYTTKQGFISILQGLPVVSMKSLPVPVVRDDSTIMPSK